MTLNKCEIVAGLTTVHKKVNIFSRNMYKSQNKTWIKNQMKTKDKQRHGEHKMP